MNTTQILPTDKHGQVYYGPRTVKAAAQRIAEIRDEYHDGRMSNAQRITAERALVARIRAAGFARVAAIVAKDYCIDE